MPKIFNRFIYNIRYIIFNILYTFISNTIQYYLIVWCVNETDSKNPKVAKTNKGKLMILSSCAVCSLTNFDSDKNVVILGVDNVSSVHIDNKRKGILLLVEGPTQASDDTTIAVEGKYSSNFTR